MKQESTSNKVHHGLTLEHLVAVLMDEVKAVFGECVLAEKICDALLIHLLCFHVSNVEVVYDPCDQYVPGHERPSRCTRMPPE